MIVLFYFMYAIVFHIFFLSWIRLYIYIVPNWLLDGATGGLGDLQYSQGWNFEFSLQQRRKSKIVNRKADEDSQKALGWNKDLWQNFEWLRIGKLSKFQVLNLAPSFRSDRSRGFSERERERDRETERERSARATETCPDLSENGWKIVVNRATRMRSSCKGLVKH